MFNSCEECGRPVFALTSRGKRFCSKTCINRRFHRTHPDRAGKHGLASCTITVSALGGRYFSFVGTGKTGGEAHENARAQAAALGPYVEVGYVTVNKIVRDLARTALHG